MSLISFSRDKFIPSSEVNLTVRGNYLSITRGYQVFTFFKTVDNGTPVFLEDHLDRITSNAKSMGMNVPFTKNDLRSLPKAVRLQILIVLSFVWSTVFSLYVFSITSFIFGWAGVVMGHIGLIIAVYITFKFFHKRQEQPVSVFQSGNFNPAKIFAVFFVIFFIFIFTKGIDVLTRTNSYETPYSGPDTTTEERIKRFVK